MDYEIDRSFIRDVKKCPVAVQKQIAELINLIEVASDHNQKTFRL